MNQKSNIMGVPKEEKTYYTVEEYLELETLTEEKFEYHNGRIVNMAGGTRKHNILCNSIGTVIDNAIDENGKKCTVFNSDMKVKIEKHNKFLYPDASVICNDTDEVEDNSAILTNPILLIEVLSKSSKDYDRGAKFEYYRSIPSFQEYMIVYQTTPKVQTWYKEAEDLWRIGNTEDLDGTITLHFIGITIALKNIYKRIAKFNENITDLY